MSELCWWYHRSSKSHQWATRWALLSKSNQRFSCSQEMELRLRRARLVEARKGSLLMTHAGSKEWVGLWRCGGDLWGEVLLCASYWFAFWIKIAGIRAWGVGNPAELLWRRRLLTMWVEFLFFCTSVSSSPLEQCWWAAECRRRTSDPSRCTKMKGTLWLEQMVFILKPSSTLLDMKQSSSGRLVLFQMASLERRAPWRSRDCRFYGRIWRKSHYYVDGKGSRVVWYGCRE